MPRITILFIHGLWMHSSSWEPWMKYFAAKNYSVFNPGWPGDGDTVELSRANPGAVANCGVSKVAEHYARYIEKMNERPILIGHSFGGLLAQILLGSDLAAAAIAIDPAPMKGVWQLPFTTLRAAFPVLGNPFNMRKAVSLTHQQFRYSFTNALPEEESISLYQRYTVPSPALPLFQAAFSIANPKAETIVNTSNPTRGPLLITAGEKDHIVPPVLSKAAYQKYKHSKAVTDYKLFNGRGHSLVIDHGWEEVAAYALQWLNEKGL